jgi:hypothetical protein
VTWIFNSPRIGQVAKGCRERPADSFPRLPRLVGAEAVPSLGVAGPGQSASPAARLVKTVARILTLVSLVTGPVLQADGERINHEGRLLGPAPVVTAPTLFNTPEADAILAAMQVFPTDNPWNEDISGRPLLLNSDAMIAQIIADLASSRRTLRAFFEMNFVLVPARQPMIPIRLFNYSDESDPSPYPIPSNLPVETWPRETGTLSLSDWQADVNGTGGDRHSIIVQPETGLIWETWLTQRVGTNWEASNGARFDLNSNGLRPSGWTSGDAAGLPMFPALVRYDEGERGVVEHAVRLVVKRTRREFIYPARHYASATNLATLPAMGQRLRLKAGFAIPEGWTRQEKAVLRAMKKYGAIVGDNGGFFSISVTPDHRWPANAFDHLASVGITNFEVVQTTGPAEGPRSAGAPSAQAGPDKTVLVGKPVALEGAVDFSGLPPAIQWRLYGGPEPVSFNDPARTNTAAVFPGPGVYTLMLSANDQLHPVGYDAVVITVLDPLVMTISRSGTSVNLSWTGGRAPYVLEKMAALSPAGWQPWLTNNGGTVLLPAHEPSAFFRLQGQ